MSIKKPKLQNNPLAWVETKKVEIQGIRLSDVQFVSPARLKANPLNQDFFQEESSDYFDRLRKDIQERGIIVPLIAKKDDTLLAGHNRLRLAKELGLGNIPVQYVLDTLPVASEREFIIKDNLYRRQFSTAEWIGLYKKLYPDFDTQIQQETRGGGQKWNKTERSVLFSEDRLTADKIARDTGQNVSAVQKQLSKYRKTLKEETLPANHEAKNSKLSPKAVNTKTVEQAYDLLQQIERVVKKENSKTIQQVIKKIDILKDKLSRLVEDE